MCSYVCNDISKCCGIKNYWILNKIDEYYNIFIIIILFLFIYFMILLLILLRLFLFVLYFELYYKDYVVFFLKIL